MAFIVALLVGIAVIAGIIAYWMVVAMLFILGMIFVVWGLVFAGIFGDPYVGGLCSIFATGLTLWLYNVYADKKV